METGNHIGDVVVGYRGAFVVQREAIGFHVVEPHLVRATRIGFCENQDGSGDTCIRLEHTRRHRNHSLQALFVNQFLADGLVACAVAEQHAIRNDTGTTATDLQHPHKQSQKQQFRLFRLGDGQQVLAHGLAVEAAGERRIGKAKRIAVGILVVGRKAVLILDVGVVNAMKHQVHRPDTQHGGIGVESVKHAVLVMLCILLFQQLFTIMALDILCRFHDETRTTHGWVTNSVFQSGLHQFHHHANDVSWGAELAVVATRCHLAQDILIHIAHRVAVVHIKVVDAFHNLHQRS